MVDIHTHILPGLDDGASDIYDTIEMAELAYESGTTVIVATPHCNLPGLYANYFGKEYSSTFPRFSLSCAPSTMYHWLLCFQTFGSRTCPV